MDGAAYGVLFASQPAPFWATALVLGYVIAQRLLELWIAKRNTSDLLANGGQELARAHYPLIVSLHAAWIVGLVVLAPGQPITLWALFLFALVQLIRFWTLATLGRRWTTRIIIVPGETLVSTGPFRYVSHPNYLVVIAELFLLPLLFGLPLYAALFSALNAAVLTVRISAEERALSAIRSSNAPKLVLAGQS